MKIIQTCPYGHTCEKMVEIDSKPIIERCVKYIAIKTVNEVTREEDEMFKCSDVWNIEIAVMNNKITGHIVHAVDEVRVQQTKRQDIALQIAGGKFLEDDIVKTLTEQR